KNKDKNLKYKFIRYKSLNIFKFTTIVFLFTNQLLANTYLPYTNYYDTQTDKSSFGGLSKSSSKINDTTISQSSSNLFSANNIDLKANNINVIASNLK
ncbi:hypothetical protein, partial [Campylobacter sp.]|uniref:hypothetical protein n=1 Tax=Campylobacter sp. TaxID=205 RepID=UPI0025879804